MILFGFFLAVAVLTAVQAATSIKGSCRDFAIDDAGLFSALCDGGKTRTAMDLNKCLVNENSFLKFRKDGNAMSQKSCIGCDTEPKGYDSSFIMCSCVDQRSGVRHNTGIELGLQLENDNGVISCFGAKGASSS